MKTECTIIERRPIKKTYYIAEDGAKFDCEIACWIYEKDMLMEKEGRNKHLDYCWKLFKDQSELDEYSNAIRAYACNIEKKGGKFPIWVRFEYCYDDNAYEEHLTIPLLKDDYKEVCELKEMIENTQL